ncbi:unannotated protein [freshwater metagenome]|uniref:Unannotated protein n=1 Tax=freshwater metagenome TaxID=449393 RepID=A0A6J6TF91_9ZZZZ|nr:ATP-binding cassette domain-containing protein [Actinomycetota bacterium]
MNPTPQPVGDVSPLELRGVSLGSRVSTRLHRTDLTLAPGSVTSIIGANGSGKSTLLRLMSADLQPTDGRVLMHGADASGLSATLLARHRSMLAQETSVAFPFLVHEVVGWGRFAWRRTPAAADDARIIDDAIESQGLTSLRDRRVTELSGGERTRVHLARVIAQRTPLLLLDEADADLDLVGRRQLDDTVAALALEGTTVVVVSHDINRVAPHTDRVIVMSRGEVHADGQPVQVLTEEILSKAFGTAVEVSDEAGRPIVRLPGAQPPGPMCG